jgi:hypothetical protein
VQDEVISLVPPGAAWIDVDAFGLAAEEARRRGDTASYEAALKLYAGDLLPEDQYEDWSSSRREVLYQHDGSEQEFGPGDVSVLPPDTTRGWWGRTRSWSSM